MSDVKITVGADPEIFLQDNNLEKIIPCVGIIPGTKDEPAILPHVETKRKKVNEESDTPKMSLSAYLNNVVLDTPEICINTVDGPLHTISRYDKKGEGYYMQEDNVMAEFNIPPCKSVKMFQTAIPTALTRLKRQLPENIQFSNRSYWVFNEDELTSPQAQSIGCEPDFDAYNMGRIRTNTPRVTNERWCGGHVHMGGQFQCPDFVAALFLEWILMSYPSMRTQDFKSWYRQPGNFRPKPYGIEYRTPSNNWLWSNKLINIVGQITLVTSSYLSTNEASEIQKSFRMVDWFKFRELLSAHDDHALKDFYEITRAKGFPL